MRIAIVHYHLRPGGVTRVIDSARAAAGDAFHLAALAGDNVPALDYAPAAPRVDPERLADQLEAAARTALGGAPDVWHIHNHSLGRNPAATAAFAALARRGRRLLLQVHDFAEDGRPSNYRLMREQLGDALGATLYPDAPHVHYAVLNLRDRDALACAGVPAERLHELPNPVMPLEAERLAPSGPPLVLYPTRALRRKNIGEFLLWAARETEGRRFALTLAPTSPADVAPYEQWKALAARLRLPVDFEAGLQPGATLASLLARAACVVTTSVAEGFGLAFTEPWLANRPLAGRGLPEITGSMESAGLDLRHLYTRLEAPVAWIGSTALRARIESALRATADAYGEHRAPDDVDRAWAAFVREDRVDFGRLDEPLQAAIIERVQRDDAARDALRPARLAIPADAAANRRVVESHFSLAGYNARLEALYRAVAGSATGPVGAHEAGAVRRFFLDPARLFLLRSS